MLFSLGQHYFRWDKEKVNLAPIHGGMRETNDIFRFVREDHAITNKEEKKHARSWFPLSVFTD